MVNVPGGTLGGGTPPAMIELDPDKSPGHTDLDFVGLGTEDTPPLESPTVLSGSGTENGGGGATPTPTPMPTGGAAVESGAGTGTTGP